MEPMDDPQLRKVLREWRVEDAPRSLDERVLGPRKPWWSFLISGSVRVPAPVALVLAAALLVMTVALLRERPGRQPPPPATTEVNLAGFQPVKGLNVRIISRRP